MITSLVRSSSFRHDILLDHAISFLTGLPPSAIPETQPTIGSPLQYNYRTKITPHFEAPPRAIQKAATKHPIDRSNLPDWLKIGFNVAGTRKVMDIEVNGIHTLPTIALITILLCRNVLLQPRQ